MQLPALLVGLPGASPAQLLATNKFGSIFGTATSSITYYRRVRPDLRTALPMAAVAYVGSIGGALIGLHIPKSAFNPIILVLLVLVGAYTILKPDLGKESIRRYDGARHTVLAMLTGFVIGVYDGALGPGTGSFLVFALVGLLGYNFLEASAKAKIANFATNLGALTVFLPMGLVLFKVGAVIAVANLIGGYVGARTAVLEGERLRAGASSSSSSARSSSRSAAASSAGGPDPATHRAIVNPVRLCPVRLAIARCVAQGRAGGHSHDRADAATGDAQAAPEVSAP